MKNVKRVSEEAKQNSDNLLQGLKLATGLSEREFERKYLRRSTGLPLNTPKVCTGIQRVETEINGKTVHYFEVVFEDGSRETLRRFLGFDPAKYKANPDNYVLSGSYLCESSNPFGNGQSEPFEMRATFVGSEKDLANCYCNSMKSVTAVESIANYSAWSDLVGKKITKLGSILAKVTARRASSEWEPFSYPKGAHIAREIPIIKVQPVK